LGRVIERNRAERELLLALERAKEADRLKSSFLANMSHEIRTPLHVILGYTDVIAEELDENTDGDLVQHLSAIRRGGNRLLDTIQGILDFSKIESGAFEAHPTPIEPATMLQSTAHDMELLSR